MLVFVIPLKSKEVSQSWESVCKLLERTLRSVCNQTSEDFRVIVVCHEQPEISFSHPCITYVLVDFPPPAADRRSKINDRARKELVGLIAAGNLGDCHILKMDADDCVSKHLAAYVNSHPKCNGWYLRKGYVYTNEENRIYLRRNDFYEWCGTCNIVQCNLLDIVRQRIQELPALPEDYLKYYIKHAKVPGEMQRRGTPLEVLPFPGAVYILGHGENSHPNSATSRLINPQRPVSKIKSALINFRPLSTKISNEFGLYSIKK